MNEKKWRILETAIRLFANQGFHQTSIQQIAEGSDVSKGTIYLYFSSKNELISSIFKYFHKQIEEKLKEIDAGPGMPKEKFHSKIHTHLSEMMKHREFIMLQIREQSLTLDESLLEVLRTLRASAFQSDQLMLLDVYGEEFRPFSLDGALLLDSIRSSITQLLLMEEIPVSLEELASFIVHRMDELNAGMREKNLPPILSEPKVQPYKNRDLYIIEEMEATLVTLSLPQERKEEILHAIDYMRTELKKTDPKPFIIRGMLTNFSGIPELESLGRKLSDNLDISLCD